MEILSRLGTLVSTSGFAAITDVRQVIMIVIACVLLYMGIVKKFEPLLLRPLSLPAKLSLLRCPALLSASRSPLAILSRAVRCWC